MKRAMVVLLHFQGQLAASECARFLLDGSDINDASDNTCAYIKDSRAQNFHLEVPIFYF
jgi:hypothetical protein